jgi:hypothetical protein
LANGVALMGNNTGDNFVTMSGLSFCSGQIKSVGSILRLQTSTATSTLDVRAAITNLDALQPVRFIDAQGADFFDTPLQNTGPSLYIFLNDTDGTYINSTLFVNNINATSGGTAITIQETATLFVNTVASTAPANLLIQPLAGDVYVGHTTGTIFLQGNVQVTGTLMANGAITSSSACCTSDIRVKTNITHVDPKSDLDRVCALPDGIRFHYNETYALSDPRVKPHHEYQSFIAQEVQKVIPNAVRTIRHTLSDGTVMEDLHQLDLHVMVPYLVGAIKELRREIESLKKKVSD